MGTREDLDKLRRRYGVGTDVLRTGGTAKETVAALRTKYGAGYDGGGSVTLKPHTFSDVINTGIDTQKLAKTINDSRLERIGSREPVDTHRATELPAYQMVDFQSVEKVEPSPDNGYLRWAEEKMETTKAEREELQRKLNRLTGAYQNEGGVPAEVIEQMFGKGFRSVEDVENYINQLSYQESTAPRKYYNEAGQQAVEKFQGKAVQLLADLADQSLRAREAESQTRYGFYGNYQDTMAMLDQQHGVDRGKMVSLKAGLEQLGYSAEDIDRAVEYLVEAGFTKAAYDKAAKQAEGNGLLNHAAAAFAAPLNLFDFLYMRSQTSGRNDTQDLANYKPSNAGDLPIALFSREVTRGVTEKIRGEDPNAWRNTLAFLYNTGFSAAQSTAITKAFGPASTIFMGGQAAASTALEVIERGGTNDQAMWSGVAAGAAEALFEAFSVDSLLKGKGDKKFWQFMLKQAGIEATEEVNTEVANILADAYIMQGNSKSQNAIRAHMAKGKTREEAERLVFVENVEAVVLAGVGGFLSGGFSSAVAAGPSSAYSSIRGTNRQKAADAVFDRVEQERVAGQKNTAPGMEAVMRPETGVAADPAADPAQVESGTAQTGEDISFQRAITETAAQGRQMASQQEAAEQTKQDEQMERLLAEMNGKTVTPASQLAQESAAVPAGKTTLPAQTAPQTASEAAKPKVGVVDSRTNPNAAPLRNVLDNREVLYLEAVSRATGMRINIADASDNADGWYENGEIFIAENCVDPVNWIATHEVTHHLEKAAPEAYAGYLERVKAILSQEGDLKKRITAVQEYYAERGTTLTEDGALRELAANFTERLMLDENLFNRIAREDRSLAQRLLDSLKEFIRKLRTVWSGQEIRQLEATRKAWEKALRESRGKTVEGGERQYLYAGQNAKTADKADGWFEGADGKQRFEIDDSGMKVKEFGGYVTHLGGLIEHPALFEAYPDLEYADVEFDLLPRGVLAHYNEKTDKFTVSRSLRNNPDELGSVLIHEIQHAIQKREGFAKGSNPEYWQEMDADAYYNAEYTRLYEKLVEAEDPEEEWELRQEISRLGERADRIRGMSPMDLYRNTAGEIEARDAESRRNLTAEQRQNRKPYTGNEDTVFADGGESGYSESQKLVAGKYMGESALYSIRGAREHEQSAAEAQKQGKRLEERAAFQRANVKNTAKPGAGELDRIAGGLLKDFSSQYDRAELTAQLERLYDRLAKGGLSGKALAAEAEQVARRVLTEVSIMGEEGAQLRRELRQTKIHVPRELWADFEAEGGYTEFRRKYMGKLQLSGETGQSIDEVYEDLSVSYPGVFDMDAVEDPVNRLLQIAEVADSLRFVSENLSATDRVNVELLAGEMVERLYDLAQKGQPLSEVRAKDRKAATDRLRETVAKRERESARKVESIRKSNREANMRQRERMNTTKLRDSVRKHADALARKLTRPTDKQHIPEHLRGSVLALLEVIDLESKFGYKFTREATFKRVNQSEGELLEPTSRTSAARALKAAYEQLRSDPEFSGVVDPDLADMLEEIAEMGNIRVADMNMEQLRTVWNAVRAVEASVTKSDKMLGASKYGKISSAADAMRAELGHREDRKNYVGALGRIDQFFNLDLLTPETFLHRMGKVGEDLNNQLRAAQDRNVEILREGIDLYKQAMKDTGVDMLKAEKELHTFELPGGTIELTTAQVMELYALSRRQAAMEHIYKGGLRAQGGKKGLVKTGKSKAVKVTFTDVADIIGVLSKEQKAFVDTLQHYMSSQLAAHGNDASMEAYGYEKFKEKFYWPIKVAPSETDTDAASEAKAKTIPGFGMTKALKPHANNSVVLRSALDSFNEHLNQMATYAAWLTTSENITKLVNYDYMAEGNRTGTVKDLLMKVYGEGGEQYIDTLLSNIAQGTKTGAGKSAITESLFGKWKAAKVGANIRVILQQPTAIIRAAEMIDAKYLAQVGNPIKGWEKAVAWAPIAQWKDWGYFEMDTGRSMRELTAGTASKLDKVKNASMWAAGKMDNIAWGMMWNAVEAETKAKHADLKAGSDEYYQAVAKRFGDVINRTQVVDSVLHRTQIMRSSNALNRFATSFMSEPSKVYNMVARDIYDIVNAEKGSEEQRRAWKHMARTGVALVASFVVNALAQSAVDALRDDDREKEYGEKFLEAYFGFTGEEEGFGEHWKSFWSGNVTGNLNPIGYIPYVKDVQSIWQGFTVDRPDMEGLADLANAAKTFAKAAAGEGNKTLWNAGLNMALKGLDAIGLPAGNLKRDLMAMYSSVLQWTGAHWMTYQLDKTMLKIGESGNRSVFCATLMRAMNDDYDAYVKIYNDMVKSGMSPEDIEMGMDRQLAAELGLTKLSLLPIDWKAPGKDAAFDKKVKSRIESEKSWEEIVGGEYLGLLRELDALRAEDGKTSVTDAQKRRHIADSNYSERIKEQAMERVLGFGTAANERYAKARSAGISTKAFVDLLDAIEAATVARKGEKGSPNQDDVEKALNKSTLTAAQKRAIWYSYGWKSESPWG